jgi:hypothetical protein
MTKEFALPNGVKIEDGHLYFGDRQVSFHGKPYKFAHIPTMAKMFAVRYTNDKCSYPTLCATFDIMVAEDGHEEPLIWVSTIRMAGERYLPSAYYSDWKSVEYVLTNFAQELQQDCKWFIEVDDINDQYAWDEERGVVRKQMKIETVEYVWADDEEPEYDSAGYTEEDRQAHYDAQADK